MTVYHLPPDCTCFNCLEKMADPKCPKCEGDGYVLVGAEPHEIEERCGCTDPAYLKRLEKVGIIKAQSSDRKETV